MTKQDNSKCLLKNRGNEPYNSDIVVIGTSGNGKKQYYKEHVKSLKSKK